MKLFKKEIPQISFEDRKQWAIEFMRKLDTKTYDKVLKTIEIYRKADEKVYAITHESEPEKEKMDEAEFEEKISEFMEA